RQAHQLSFDNPRGNVDAHGARAQFDRAVALDLGVAQLERARRTAKRLFKIQLHARVLVAAGARARSTRGTTPTLAEERREKVAELLIGERGIPVRPLRPAARPAAPRLGRLRCVPARGRPKLLSGLPVAPELIVGSALLRILQHLVGLLPFFEARVVVAYLAHIREVLTRHPPLGALD